MRVLIVDDHPIVLEGLKTYLGLQSDITVVAEASSAKEAREKTEAFQPEVVLLDLMLPDESGLTLIPVLRSMPHSPKILILTSLSDEDMVREALRLGASGYLMKHSGPDVLVDGLRAVMRGELPLDPSAVKVVLSAKKDPLEALTPRELEVLSLIGKGMSNKNIAANLSITEKTVKTHVSSIFSKLNLKDRVQAALYASERKL